MGGATFLCWRKITGAPVSGDGFKCNGVEEKRQGQRGDGNAIAPKSCGAD